MIGEVFSDYRKYGTLYPIVKNTLAVLIEPIHVGFRDYGHPPSSRAFRWMSLLHLSRVADKPTVVAE